MIEAIKTQRDDIIGFRIDGTISEADIKPLLPVLKEKLKYYDKLKLYVEYVDIHGFSMDTLIEDLRFNFGHLGAFEKAAVVTSKDWLTEAAHFAANTNGMKLKSFHFSEKDQAIRWIEQ